MPSMQIVFLFDLNAFSDDNFNIPADFNKKLVSLRLTCLKVLTHYFALEPNLKWGFKFFDSKGSLTQKMYKFSFHDLSLDGFETLENEITVRYQRHISYIDALSTIKSDLSPSDNVNSLAENKIKKKFPLHVLQLALTQLLCEFQWSSQIPFFSPSKKKGISNHDNKSDLLFLITKCPRKEQSFLEYFGADISCLTPAKFSKLLLSHSLQEQLLKSSVLWIWLDTNIGNFLTNHTEEVLSKLADMLNCLKCTLVPMSLFSHLPSIAKFNESSSQSSRMDLINSLLPFSAIISQSLSHQFYSNNFSKPGEAVISLQNKELFVHLIKVPLDSERKDLNTNFSTFMNETDYAKANNLTWSKFLFHFALPKIHTFHSCANFISLPAAYGDEANFKQFQDLCSNLIRNDFILFIVCETTCGVKMPGFFSPITGTSGMIFIVSFESFFDISATALNMTEVGENINQFSSFPEDSNPNPGFEKNVLKPFQIECFEQWFEPTSSISAISTVKESENSHHNLKSFYKQVSQKFIKQLPKPTPEKENIAPNDGEEKEKLAQLQEVLDVSRLSYDELIRLLNEEYDMALKPGHSLLQSAQKIVKSAFSFFQHKSPCSLPANDTAKDFLKEFFYVSNQKICEKYDETQETDKRIRECQLQVFLALETEILAQSFDKLYLIKNITSCLRCMSFFCGSPDSDLNKFLQEVLIENYKDSLYDVLVEIGEELHIPLFGVEEDSPYELSEPLSSESMLGSNNSRVSSFSAKSSSGSSSRADNRKLIRCREDIMNNSKSRQILLPKSSPKKKKYKNLCPGAENIPIRYSPRLSSKRRKERSANSSMKANHVRRNLFPKDQKPSTPKYSQSPHKRKKMRTPKAHHVLKTNFVAETPTSKQSLSSLQRRKSFMDTDDSETSLTEIAESPTVKKKKGGTSTELMKKLINLESKNFLQPMSQPVPSSSSFSQYTPESKRRLSLKLFSKLLTSPTARMGLKKCSKRLFDQVSPQKSCKRPKLDPELKNKSIEKSNISFHLEGDETPKKSC